MVKLDYPDVEVRLFKWPYRPRSVAQAYLIDEDIFGKWIGVAKGNLRSSADGSTQGVFDHSFIKLFPHNTYWTACFGFADHPIDVDISLPAKWSESTVEEVDLELDVIRTSDGLVYIRDEDEFQQVVQTFSMPDDIAQQAEQTCLDIRFQIEKRQEPFGEVGLTKLAQFLNEVQRADSST